MGTKLLFPTLWDFCTMPMSLWGRQVYHFWWHWTQAAICSGYHAIVSQEIIDLSIYSPSNSSTSKIVSCNSTLCGQTQCPSANSNCPYNVSYISSNTSSTGILVEDILHLITDDDQQKAVDTPITFGCGQIQTGIFLEGAAPNGLFGLGIENISVPSTLARNGLASNSFALCFGRDGVGRISFGNNGSSDQRETPFNIRQLHPTYNISITQITVGQNSSELEFSAIFDSGTSFTSLRDPAYTFISESFDSQIKEKRYTSDPQLPFDYCYYLSANQTSPVIPDVNLTMKGGDTYFLNNPTVKIVPTQDFYCLALLKSEVNIDIIGQNFMTGYQIVFDRERMVLGWKDSNCYNDQTSNNLPISP
ncbi:aspartyl protease family protein 1-like isoform X2 [Juglans regia]|uniref:Aspartyl protease family protein 1-like isoform X2 n=1 Tax=Juglans regia TaxID=51240 RepID=A0A6P9EQA6_JUGRE|nr:aspartyl protease family protein 1-like isoform X2 [Juglans regia]